MSIRHALPSYGWFAVKPVRYVWSFTLRLPSRTAHPRLHSTLRSARPLHCQRLRQQDLSLTYALILRYLITIFNFKPRPSQVVAFFVLRLSLLSFTMCHSFLSMKFLSSFSTKASHYLNLILPSRFTFRLLQSFPFNLDHSLVVQSLSMYVAYALMYLCYLLLYIPYVLPIRTIISISPPIYFHPGVVPPTNKRTPVHYITHHSITQHLTKEPVQPPLTNRNPLHLANQQTKLHSTNNITKKI